MPKAAPDDSTPAGGSSQNPFAAIPAVASLIQLVRAVGVSTLDDRHLTRYLQDVVSRERVAIEDGARPGREEVERRAVAAVAALERTRLSPVLNATGVLIHTNLGRAPVSSETAAAMAAAAAGYVPLELDPETNERGGRLREISTLMRLLTGAEAAIVVNNNAAAILIALSAVAAGRSVIVSRGEAVEIGGGFRIPDVLRQSGATLVEVGTTNRTYARDYAEAIDGSTAAILKVHPSNFRVSGFTAAASIAELARVAAPRALPVIEDLGSGALLDAERFGLDREPTIATSLGAGASIVTASGDKLLGGPQAGIIVGRRDWIARIEAHPLARAVRADKTCLAGLSATLRHYARGEAEWRVPIWRMIALAPDAIRHRAEALSDRLSSAGFVAEVWKTDATVGGGSLPGQVLPSFAVAIAAHHDLDASGLARRLRLGDPAVFGRIEERHLLLDLRSVLPEDDGPLGDSILAALR